MRHETQTTEEPSPCRRNELAIASRGWAVVIDPEALKLGTALVAPKKMDRRKAPTAKKGEHFLRGPIPMDWLKAASKASGKGCGFQVAIALWYLSGLNRQARTVKLSGSILLGMGINRHACYRGLAALEAAKLVEVDRLSGQCPTVTLRDLEWAG